MGCSYNSPYANFDYTDERKVVMSDEYCVSEAEEDPQVMFEPGDHITLREASLDGGRNVH